MTKLLWMNDFFKIFILILLSFQFCLLQGQNSRIDSIAELLEQHPERDTSRVNLLIDLGFDLYLSNTDTVKILAEQALEISEEIDYKKGKARSLRLYGIYYDMKSNYPMALEYYQEALTISEAIGDKRIISDCLNSMGVIYSDQGNQSQALAYYKKALATFEELNNQRGISFCLNNIGVIYYDKKKLQDALNYYKRSLKIDKDLGSIGGVAIGLNNMGEVYRDMGQYDTALYYFTRSLKIAKEITDIYGESYLYMDFASVYYLTKDYEKALNYSKTSLDYALLNGYFDIQKDVYLQLANIYNALNDYEKAYENHVLHKKISDSIYSEKDLEKTIGLEYHYKYEKERQATKLLQEEELKRQKMLRNSLIVGILLLLALILVIIRGLLQKSQTNKILFQKNQSIEKKSKRMQEQNSEIQQLYEELTAVNEVLFAQKEELEKHRNNLESLVSERTIELEKAKEKAEESDRLKSAFLTNMSHEIRTPLNAIVGFADLLSDSDTDQSDKNELLTHMNHSTETLLKLIDDIFDIAKIESGQLSISKSYVSIKNLINKLVPIYEEKQARLGKEDVQFIIDQPPSDIVIFTDPFRLQQILINLLDNAFKFTEKGKIDVGFERDENEYRVVKFYVKDTGIGMNQRQIDYIFDRFIKLEEDAQKIYRGAGLGLAISKNIVELLGGKLWVDSEMGKGSTFYFSIPDLD